MLVGGDAGSVHGLTEAGIAGKHSAGETNPLLIAPATGEERNEIRAGLIPVACWRVDNIRFQFASSFVMPSIKPELASLKDLVHDHPECPLSIFGHADPVGDDASNKKLSGRRATAIYGLLTRDTGLWEKLYGAPAGDDIWGDSSLGTMLAAVSPEDTDIAPHRSDPAKRRQLFSDYMDKLCGPGLLLAKSDFLARGQDPGGKGDYQGCSEFNPMLIFSSAKQQEFAQGSDNAARDEANAPNRRVMVLIFRGKSRVDPAKWPCPRAADGVAGCVKRFWSDGERRRGSRLPDRDRTFEEDQDTFACRFYQRLTAGSPCQKTLKFFQVRLYDPLGKALALAPYRLTVGERTFPPEEADDKGLILGREVEVPNRCLVEWALPDSFHRVSEEVLVEDPSDVEAAESGDATEDDIPDMPGLPPGGEALGNGPPVKKMDFPFRLEIFLHAGDGEREQQAKQMLNNLGYLESLPLVESVAAFQNDYADSRGLTATGVLNNPTLAAIQDVHRGCRDDLRTKPKGTSA